MSWDDLRSEVSDLFAEYTWRVDDIQAAFEIRRERLREKNREYGATYRTTHKYKAKKRDRREYMREYMREYDNRRRRDDVEYLERRRKTAREAMRRVYARKRGEIIELRKTGGSLPGVYHRPHCCRVCGEVGHNRRRHAA